MSCSSRELVACTRGLNLSWWIVGESGDKTCENDESPLSGGLLLQRNHIILFRLLVKWWQVFTDEMPLHPC